MSTQIEFRKTQLAIALAAAFASGATVAADVVDPNGWSSVQLTDYALIQQQTLVNNTSNGTGTSSIPPYYINNNDGTSTSYTVTAVGAYNQTVTSTSGGVLAESNGNLTLTGGSQTVDTSTFDVAVTFLTNNSTGLPINGTAGNSTGLYNATTGAFNPGQSVNTTESTYLGGGNLTMDGTATIKNGMIVSTRNSPTGDENSGRGRLLVDGVQTQIGAINGYGATNGITSNANETTITGGMGGWGWNSQARVELKGTEASLTNSNGKGVHVYADRTVLSGGAASTYLTMGNSAATFSSNADGTGPITVTGIANGSGTYDAVNYGQFVSGYNSLKRDIKDVESKAYGGIASAVALADIPAPAAGKQYTIGAGWGNYEGENAFALGGRAQITPEFQLTAGWGYSSEGNAFNVGAGYSW